MKFLIAFLFCILSGSSFAAEARFGRYVGVLRHQNTSFDQLARLDFISEVEADGVLKLKATLVLYFGSFESDEYASYDYDSITYNLLTGTLVFDNAEREVHFVVNKFNAGSLTAELRTGSGTVGQLILSQNSEVIPGRPLIQPVWGEYRGICHGVGQRLQIQSSPSHPIATNRTDPFAPFIIMAQRGDNGGGGGCPIGSTTCITDIFLDADYDFFNAHIDFHGNYGSLSCEVDEAGLTCGECRYTRSSDDGFSKSAVTVPSSQPHWNLVLNDQAPSASLQGVYSGYVHMEQRDIYQVMTIGLSTYRQPSGGPGSPEALMMSAVASLKFGGHTGNDQSINTKFDPRPFNILSSQPVFDRIDHTTDMILKIQRIGSSVIEGTWFSRRFGRVGSFLLTSSGHVELLSPEKLDSKLTGNFSDGLWNISMNVGMSDHAISAKDPFSPLTILGHLWLRDLTIKKPFTDSAYDPFTGKFSLSINDGGTVFGKRTANGIRIRRPNAGIMRPMSNHKFIELTEVK